jgi:hypothetical protein
MKIGIKHIIVFLALGLPLLNLTYGAIMNYSGYCFKKNKYLTFDDKIEHVFKYANGSKTIYLPVDNKLTEFKNLPYISFEEYLKENPDCCMLIPINNPISPAKKLNLPPPDFLERITGGHSGEVIIVNFRYNYFDRGGQLTFMNLKHTHVLTNCGNIRD